jgi:hypothetical protein
MLFLKARELETNLEDGAFAFSYRNLKYYFKLLGLDRVDLAEQVCMFFRIELADNSAGSAWTNRQAFLGGDEIFRKAVRTLQRIATGVANAFESAESEEKIASPSSTLTTESSELRSTIGGINSSDVPWRVQWRR